MNCQQFLAAVGDYVDDQIDPEICAQLEQHIGDCDACRVVVDSVRKTVRLYRGEQPIELPEAFRSRLHHELRSRWKQQRGE